MRLMILETSNHLSLVCWVLDWEWLTFGEKKVGIKGNRMFREKKFQCQGQNLVRWQHGSWQHLSSSVEYHLPLQMPTENRKEKKALIIHLSICAYT